MPNSKTEPIASAGLDLDLARQVLRIEAAAIEDLLERVDQQFVAAVEHLDACTGRVIVTGMGKSGIISRKIAATLTSTGTPAFFLHPAEAVHGDLGVIQRGDLVVALSHTGETNEILRLLETIKRVGAKVVCLTGAPDSTLAQAADVTLDCQVRVEACPMNLVPTASTTATLAMGDALAMTLLVKKDFREDDFAGLHPGGGIGKRLLRVDRLMRKGTDLPTVNPETPMDEVAREISAKRLGMTCVTDAAVRLTGVITDGDLRRCLADEPNLLKQVAADVMTTDPHTITPSTLAAQALQIMEAHRITSLVVVDEGKELQGVIHLHDLWRTELF